MTLTVVITLSYNLLLHVVQTGTFRTMELDTQSYEHSIYIIAFSPFCLHRFTNLHGVIVEVYFISAITIFHFRILLLLKIFYLTFRYFVSNVPNYKMLVRDGLHVMNKWTEGPREQYLQTSGNYIIVTNLVIVSIRDMMAFLQFNRNVFTYCSVVLCSFLCLCHV